MSSMMKKKTGPGFKPQVRPRRPAPPQAQAQPFRAPEIEANDPNQIKPASAPESLRDTPLPAHDAPQPPDSSTRGKPVDTEEGHARDTAASLESSTSTVPAAPPRPQSRHSSTRNRNIDDRSETEALEAGRPATPAAEAGAGVQTSSLPATGTRKSKGSRATPALQDPTADRAFPAPTPNVPTIRTPADDASQSNSRRRLNAPEQTRKRLRSVAQAENDTPSTVGPEAATPEEASSTNGKVGPKRRASQPAQRRPRKQKQSNGESEQQGDGSVEEPRPKRRRRSATPEDAEDQVVDGSKLTLQDLTKDLRIGKKFSRHDELVRREREKSERAALARRRKSRGLDDGDDASTQSGTPVPNDATSSVAPPRPVVPAEVELEPQAVQFTVVDGHIVLDQSSLTIDRHARALERDRMAGVVLTEEEEHDFSRLTTSNSFRTGSKIRGPNIWNEEETELLYRGLRMFGTDFQLISAMFPGRSRRHVKMKFNREEKANPARIHSVLVGEKTVAIDLEEYKQLTKKEFAPTEDIMAEHKARQLKHDEEEKRKLAEREEEMRRKKEALFADAPGEGDGVVGPGIGGGDMDGKRQKKKRNTKKALTDTSMYGEIVEETLV